MFFKTPKKLNTGINIVTSRCVVPLDENFTSGYDTHYVQLLSQHSHDLDTLWNNASEISVTCPTPLELKPIPHSMLHFMQKRSHLK